MRGHDAYFPSSALRRTIVSLHSNGLLSQKVRFVEVVPEERCVRLVATLNGRMLLAKCATKEKTRDSQALAWLPHRHRRVHFWNVDTDQAAIRWWTRRWIRLKKDAIRSRRKRPTNADFLAKEGGQRRLPVRSANINA